MTDPTFASFSRHAACALCVGAHHLLHLGTPKQLRHMLALVWRQGYRLAQHSTHFVSTIVLDIIVGGH